MFVKLSVSLLLLFSIKVSEGGQHSEEHPAKTRAVDFLECDVVKRLTYVDPGSQITVVSPNWPKNYGRWEHCGWRFWTLAGASLTFFCDEVKLSSGDPLQVYQDLTADNTKKNEYSMANGTLHFPEGSLNVEFSSSLLFGSSGFKCHVQSKSKKTTPAPTSTVQSGPGPENPAPETQPEGPVAETEKPTPEPENPAPETQPEGPVAETEKPAPEPENPAPEIQPEGPVAETEKPAPEPENPVPKPNPENPPPETEKPTVEEEVPGNEDLNNGIDASPVEPEEPTAIVDALPTTEAPATGEGAVLQCSGIQSGIFVEPESSVTLVSPGYPNMYPVITKCGWDIKTTQGVGLLVSCDFFSLNKHDFLLLAHGPRANQHKFVMDHAPQRRKFSKSRLMVRFSSSLYTPGAGFSCSVTTFTP